MRTGLILLILFFAFREAYTQKKAGDTVRARYFMIFSPDVNNKKYNDQLLLLAKNPLGLDTRNILILEIFPEGGLETDGTAMDESRAENLRSDYKIRPDEFRVILKDVDESLPVNQSELIDCPALFKIIDGKTWN